MLSEEFNHHPGQLQMQCGVSRFGMPVMGSWLSYGLGSESRNLPGYVVLTAGRGSSGGATLWQSGFLPSSYAGVLFRSTGEPVLNLDNPKGLSPQLQRKGLATLRTLNQNRHEKIHDPEIAARIAAIKAELHDVDAPAFTAWVIVESLDELVGWFEKACRPDGHLIGTEQEKFGCFVNEQGILTPVRYRDHVLPTLEALRDRFGWERGPDKGTDGELVMLVRDGASITLEPGGQFELSGKPLPTVHHTCAEFSQHYEELHSIAEPMGVAWIACGFHPFAT